MANNYILFKPKNAKATARADTSFLVIYDYKKLKTYYPAFGDDVNTILSMLKFLNHSD